MRVRSFNELSDELVDFGYPEHWVTLELMQSIVASTTGFTISGMMKNEGEQFYASLDFKIAGGAYELEKMSMSLLKPEYVASRAVELGQAFPKDKWITGHITAVEILPAHYLQTELLAGRELRSGKIGAEISGPEIGSGIADVAVEKENKTTTNHYVMNRNSLENFRAEAERLKIPQEMVTAAEQMMEKGIEKFSVQGQLAADKGVIDLEIHLKKSGVSDYYYLNKFEIAQSKALPLKDGHQYMIISEKLAGMAEAPVKKLDSAVQAMEYFKAQSGNVELAIGKHTKGDFDLRETVATMKEGKVDYVQKEFGKVYYSPVLQNAHYLDRGKGFTVEQATNMLQGRAVFRDDLVSRAGEPYKAWSTYQFDQEKDKYGNYTLKQYGQNYGFDVRKELLSYNIKDIDKPEVLKSLAEKLENGNRPLVTVTGADGKEQRLHVEAVPRYTNLNFFEEKGRPVKREELKKEQELDQSVGKEKALSKEKEKGKSAENELSM